MLEQADVTIVISAKTVRRSIALKPHLLAGPEGGYRLAGLPFCLISLMSSGPTWGYTKGPQRPSDWSVPVQVDRRRPSSIPYKACGGVRRLCFQTGRSCSVAPHPRVSACPKEAAVR